jgi:hypothetical protein
MGNLRGVSAVSDAQAGKVEEGSGRAGEIRRIAKIAENCQNWKLARD